jgi:YidC/Oxa1 family membrane protein insertase
MHSISKFFGTIFQPIFHAIAWLLAFFYGLVPNYIFAIVLLTVVIMGILTPLTVKSTKSMMAMQKLQPEIKKLQQKYKGAENRQLLNDEMMKLYREEGVNPVGGCLPMLLQAPFLFILYSVIKGLAFTVTTNSGYPPPRRDVPEPHSCQRSDQGLGYGPQPQAFSHLLTRHVPKSPSVLRVCGACRGSAVLPDGATQ